MNKRLLLKLYYAVAIAYIVVELVEAWTDRLVHRVSSAVESRLSYQVDELHRHLGELQYPYLKDGKRKS